MDDEDMVWYTFIGVFIMTGLCGFILHFIFHSMTAGWIGAGIGAIGGILLRQISFFIGVATILVAGIGQFFNWWDLF